jgi:glutamate synthase (NADPH/NADH) small chain
LACADELSKLGYAVTIFESQQLPGGLLLFGIPSFKLEKAVVERRVNILKQQGVEFKVGVTVGKDISLDGLLEAHQAVFLGIGALKPKPLDVPGAELKGVYQGLPFLAQKNAPIALGLPLVEVKGKRVVVLGGGDSAMIVPRRPVARRMVCAYRRDLANMPGSRRIVASKRARFVLDQPARARKATPTAKCRRALCPHGVGRWTPGRRKPRAVKARSPRCRRT